jgi:beta propeller repeat protein
MTLLEPGPRAAVAALVALCVGCGTAVSRAPSSGGDAAPPDDAARDASADSGRSRERCNGRDDDGDGRVDEGCPLRVTRDLRDDTYPTMSRGRLAWQCGDGAVCLRDLATGDTRALPWPCLYPWLSGDRVACFRPGQTVAGYSIVEIPSGRETFVPVADASWYQAPVLDGDLLAWSQIQRGSEEDYEVYAHDLATRRTVRVTNDPAIQIYPRIEGRSLVWTDDRRGHHTIGLLHLSDLYAGSYDSPAAQRQLTRREGSRQVAHVAAFDGGRVLTEECTLDPARNYDVVSCQPTLYELATGARTALSPEAAVYDVAMDLSGRWAVVESDPLGASDLFLIDVRSGTRRALTHHPRHSTGARIQGNTVAWIDDRDDQWDLYTMDLTDVDAGDLSPEGLTP